MEPNIYEDPGQFQAKPPPSLPTGGHSAPTRGQSAPTGGQSVLSLTAPADPFSCQFEDTFTEARDPHVPDAIQNCYKLTYTKVLYGFYVFLSVLIGPIFVVLFGIILGCTSFTISWILSPLFRCTSMCFVVWERFITGYLNCCLAPYCRVVGGCCSRMVIRYQKVPPGEVIHV